MAKWAAEGVSASQIAKRLNEDGVPTKAASLGESGAKRLASRRARGVSEAVERPAWVSSTVLRILRDPRLAGYAIEWQGRVQATKDSDGNPVPGKTGRRVILRDDEGQPVQSHEALIPTEEWWKLQDVLDGRTQVVVRAGRRVPTLPAGHGLLFCDVCGSVMVTDRRAGKLYYKCNRAGGVVPGHGGLVIGQDAADSETAGRVWARLMAMDPADPEDLEWVAEASRRFARPQDTSQRDAERAAVRVELEHVRESRRILHVDRLAGVHADGTGAQMFRESMARLAAHEERAAERLAELEATGNRSIQIPNEWTSVDGGPIGEGSTWAAWDLEKKRDFLALFIDSVRIAKSVGRGRNANTRDRVIVRWAESPEPAAA